MNTKFFSYKDAMNYLGIKSPITLHSYIKHGLLVIKICNSKKISKDSIDKFMKEHQKVVND